MDQHRGQTLSTCVNNSKKSGKMETENAWYEEMVKCISFKLLTVWVADNKQQMYRLTTKAINKISMF